MIITFIMIALIGVSLWIYMLTETIKIYYKHKVLTDYRNSRRTKKV